ncbi:MAG: dTDP-4-dehydrorhamnose reductase [Candidatus Woesebacteria bacterium GW2011_GWA1_39_21]|uniref:dTDP-4-dehydrorhamnose reductase n=1 Tax=Candidatus Woesebacteria bacterium GW2011_GWA1_39_21 TaxID=1618550 RepID=A0A0G0N409_9BACT|nr:MAG: dTDP-4-dehydrorhamnose reductase [Candidatus Woesebacteria bacterium GW2011_GWA1_39_21]
MDKYIITGVSGFIGRNLLNCLPKDQVLGIYHQNPPPTHSSSLRIYVRHDLTKPIKNRLLKQNDGHVVIHCASYAHINKCEVERDLGPESLAWKGNVVATQNVIDYCKKYKKKLVFLSTECVFSGEKKSYTETDKKKPINWYGYTKSVAEDEIIDSGLTDYLIVRGVVAYGQGGIGSNLIQGLVSNLIFKGTTTAVTDQNVSFTYVDDITEGIFALIKHRSKGIYHIAGSQVATPYELALKVCKRMKIPQNRVKPVTMVEFFGKEEAKLRSKNAVLNSKKFSETTGRKTISLDEGLEKIFIR